jgi:hypothetical protein
MDFQSFIFMGLGVAVSVLGFFLKRIKEEVDRMKVICTKLQISTARDLERLKQLEKLAEDRREDVKNIFKQINK